jgi:class 3 adenylate cyclase
VPIVLIARTFAQVGRNRCAYRSRIEALAAPGEILVSSLVKELVAGSGNAFEDRGEHELRGIPDAWRLFAATL